MVTRRVKDPEKNGWWDRRQVAVYHGISVRTLHNWVQEGILPQPRRFGGLCRWSREQIMRIATGLAASAAAKQRKAGNTSYDNT